MAFFKGPIKKHLAAIIIVAFSTSPAFALGLDDRNLFLIGLMTLSPIGIVLFGANLKLDRSLIGFMLCVVLLPILFNANSYRVSTVLFSIMYCTSFLFYKNCITRNYLSAMQYSKLLKSLIVAYFVVIVIQQFCVLLNLPVFNLSRPIPNEPWKLNSLSAEPSHSARIVPLLMYCYISMRELLENKTYNGKLAWQTDASLWFCFLWTMLTMGSGTAFFFLPVILYKVFRKENFFLLFISFGVIVAIGFLDIHALDRSYRIFNSLFTLSPDEIVLADHSASVRIIPFIVLSSMVSIGSFEGWLGHGIDYVSTFMGEYIPFSGENISGGGLLQTWIEYGFITFIWFVVFTVKSVYVKRNNYTLIFWLLLIFSYGINSQILWLCVLLLYTNKYFVNSIKNGITR